MLNYVSMLNYVMLKLDKSVSMINSLLGLFLSSFCLSGLSVKYRFHQVLMLERCLVDSGFHLAKAAAIPCPWERFLLSGFHAAAAVFILVKSPKRTAWLSWTMHLSGFVGKSVLLYLSGSQKPNPCFFDLKSMFQGSLECSGYHKQSTQSSNLWRYYIGRRCHP